MADDWRLTDAEISSLIYALDYPHTDEDVARDIAEAQGLKALEWAKVEAIVSRQAAEIAALKAELARVRDEEARECAAICHDYAFDQRRSPLATGGAFTCKAAIERRIKERVK